MEKYDIPDSNSLSDKIKLKIKSNVEFVSKSVNKLERMKNLIYAFRNIGRDLKQANNNDLYEESVKASLYICTEWIKEVNTTKELEAMIGHFLIKVLYQALDIGVLNSNDDVVKIAKLTASMYERRGQNAVALDLYERIDEKRFEEDISRLSKLQDWVSDGDNIEGVVFNYETLDIQVVKDFFNSLSLKEILTVEPIAFFEKLQKLANL